MSSGTSADVRIGIDVGSVAMKLIVTDDSGGHLRHVYRRTLGRPVETALSVLEEELGKPDCASIDLLAGTGSMGRLICRLLGIPFVNEVTCQAAAIRHLHPQARTLIEMGGQDSKLIFLSENDQQPVADFAMNSNCAAGTGSFLDQQASRLGLRIEDEFGELALKSTNPPRVAGRCSVFAKSDMIHLQQQAAPLHDIVAGLCLGLARNLKSNLGRGMRLPKPIAFCGGVAANKGVARAIEQVFGLEPGELVVPECHAVTGALGATLVCLGERVRRGPAHGRPGGGRIDLKPLRQYLDEPRSNGSRLSPLTAASNGHPAAIGLSPIAIQQRVRDAGGPIDAWLGLDVGSISTKAAVIDSDNVVLAKVYLMTAGRPLDAVRQVLSEIGRQVDGLVRIRGAATTGSGRYLTGDFIGADLVINEITAQATAAAAIDPEVDTIFEIGGQDSKYIALDRGVVVDFEMNHACSAGTGSFLEEQAERLGISIKEQFADLALASRSPIRLGERCTVFMESDMVSHQQQGAATSDLVAGLSYSIVANYINRVVGHRKIGRRIFFQGGTAYNKAVAAAFEAYTGSTITVPPHHEVTGAIGAALLARRHQERIGAARSTFGGFDLAEIECTVRSFECPHCSNNCEINEVMIPGREPLYYGSRCDRYNLKKAKRSDDGRIPNLFAERHRMLLEHARLLARKAGDARPVIGLPLALSNYQLLPLWGTLLDELGFRAMASPVSSPAIVERGVEAVLSTPCFPVKVAHGHVLELIAKGVKRIWLPSIVSMPRDYLGNAYNQLCPYVTSIPYQVAPVVEASGPDVALLKPAISLQEGVEGLRAALLPMCRELGVTRQHMRRAIDAAWQAQGDFERACRDRGRQVLAELPPGRRALVIVSRPYNGCDSGVSLDLPGKLRKLGELPIPMDFLDLRSDRPADDRVFAGMYWKYGQRILHAGRVIRDDPRLHAVYLSNFGCGPDSFLAGFFKRLMSPRPCLMLEIDEHSADAGVVTRLEAFLESLNNVAAQPPPPRRVPLLPLHQRNGHRRTLYIPWMGDSAYPVAAAMRACGQPAQVIEPADVTSIELGRRHCSGKECLPCIITAGDMIRLARRPGFDPASSAFFMPGGSGPCRFGQYNAMHQLILGDVGLGDVPIVSPSHDMGLYDDFKALAGDFARRAWVGICAVEMIHKALLALRPYERQAGQADAVYGRWLECICDLIEQGERDDRIARETRAAAAAFGELEVDRSDARPRIGVLGEVYVRLHSGANNDLVRQLESLGAEVAMAPFTEYMLYSNWTRMVEAREAWSPRPWLVNFLQDRVQRRIHRTMADAFRPLLGQSVVDEPPTRDVLAMADRYIDRSFVGEAVLSVGKAVEMHQHGCSGIANVMPFSCMPSTIVGGLLKGISAECDGIPVVSISYDGQQDPTLQTRLEAFVQQARAYQQRRVPVAV
jgi:predicted CoA-substrate-specific enzyme activase